MFRNCGITPRHTESILRDVVGKKKKMHVKIDRNAARYGWLKRIADFGI